MTTTTTPAALLAAAATVLTLAAGCASHSPRPTTPPPASPGAAATTPRAATGDCLSPDATPTELDACQVRLVADLPAGLLDAHGQPPQPYDLTITGRLLCMAARDHITAGVSALGVAADAENTITTNPNAPVGHTWLLSYLATVFADLCPDVGAYLSAAYTPPTTPLETP